MKYFIKSSFFTVLLMAIFTVGFSCANAKAVKKGKKVSKSARKTVIKTTPVRCKRQFLDFLAFNKFSNQNKIINLLNIYTGDCDFSFTHLQNGETIFVLTSCTIEIVHNDNSVTKIYPDGRVQQFPAPTGN